MDVGFFSDTLLRRVEHVDTDASGVVHFSRYASLMETATLELLEKVDINLFKLDDQGLDLRIRNLQIKYVSPAFFGDGLIFKVKIQEHGIAYIKIRVCIYKEKSEIDSLITDGALEFVCVDLKTGKPSRFPADMYQRIEGLNYVT